MTNVADVRRMIMLGGGGARVLGGDGADQAFAGSGRSTNAAQGQDHRVIIRVASGRDDDAAVVAQLQVDAMLAAYGRIFPASAPPPVLDEVVAEWQVRLGGDGAIAPRTLVAVDGDEIVGVVVAGPDPMRPERGHVARFYVAPDRWGQGIGRRLYAGAIEHLGRSDHREATLWVLERNSRACAWYERMGWRTTGERKMVYEPAGIVDLQYLIDVPAALERAAEDVDRRAAQEGSGPPR